MAEANFEQAVVDRPQKILDELAGMHAGIVEIHCAFAEINSGLARIDAALLRMESKRAVRKTNAAAPGAVDPG